MKKINFLLFVLVSMLAIGCLYESDVPFTYQKSAADPKLLGSWEILQPGDFYVKFSANQGNIGFAYHDKVTHAVGETVNGYCARLGGIPFIIYRAVSEGKAQYTFARYDFQENGRVLKLTFLDEELFRVGDKVQQFKTATELRNFMLRNIEKIRAFQDNNLSITLARKNSGAFAAWQKERENAAANYPQLADNAFSSEFALNEISTSCPQEFIGTWMHDSKIKRVKIVASGNLYDYTVSVSDLSLGKDNNWQWNDYQPCELKFYEIEGQIITRQKIGTRYCYFQYFKQNGKLAIRYVNAGYVRKYRAGYEFDDANDLGNFFERHIKRAGFFTEPFYFTAAGNSPVIALEVQKTKVWDTWYARYGYQEAPYDLSSGKYNPKVYFETKYESNKIGTGIWIGSAWWTTAKNETAECTLIYDPEGGMRIFSENTLAQRLAQQETTARYAAQNAPKESKPKQSSDDNEELKNRAMLSILGMVLVGALVLSVAGNESSQQTPSTAPREIVGYDINGMPIDRGPTSRTIYYNTEGKRIKWD